jgi:hypothetical protein
MAVTTKGDVISILFMKLEMNLMLYLLQQQRKDHIASDDRLMNNELERA